MRDGIHSQRRTTNQRQIASLVLRGELYGHCREGRHQRRVPGRRRREVIVEIAGKYKGVGGGGADDGGVGGDADLPELELYLGEGVRRVTASRDSSQKSTIDTVI